MGASSKLALDATVVSNLNRLGDTGDIVEALAPTQIPLKIGMSYKGRTFMPLVIESVGMPLDSSINSSGSFVFMQVPLTLCSLSAMDKDDWTKTRTVSLGSSFSDIAKAVKKNLPETWSI